MPERHTLARLVESQGTRIRVLGGRVWITEPGAVEDHLLEPGAEYVVAGPGLVVVEQEAIDRRGETARIVLSSPCELPAIWRSAFGRQLRE